MTKMDTKLVANHEICTCGHCRCGHTAGYKGCEQCGCIRYTWCDAAPLLKKHNPNERFPTDQDITQLIRGDSIMSNREPKEETMNGQTSSSVAEAATNSNSKWTPEPWELMLSTSRDELDIGKEGARTGHITVHVMLSGGQGNYAGGYDDAMANARRIVACVNELAGKPEGYIAALEQQSNVLAAALHTIAAGMTGEFPGAPDVMNAASSESFRSDMWTWSQKVARAALAKMTP